MMLAWKLGMKNRFQERINRNAKNWVYWRAHRGHQTEEQYNSRKIIKCLKGKMSKQDRI